MNMDTKTIPVRTVGAALTALVVAGTLLWARPDRQVQVASPSVASHAAETLDTEDVRGDRPPLRPGGEEAKVSKRELDRALADMNDKLAVIRVQMAQLQHAPAAPPAPEHDAVTDPRVRQEAEQQAETQLRAQEAMIEETIRREPADPAWAPAAQAAFATLFQSKEVKALKLVDLQCRTTLCRIEVAADEAGAEGTSFDQSLRKLVLHAPWQGEGFGHVAPPDSLSPTAVFFLAREGRALPQPPP
jgi:hypothetical protein